MPGTLLLALYMPDADPTTADPDAIADDIADVVTAHVELYDNLTAAEVSAIPGPQWVTAESLARLRDAARQAVTGEYATRLDEPS